MKLHFFVVFLISAPLLFGLCKAPNPGISRADAGELPRWELQPFLPEMIDTSWAMPIMPSIKVGAELFNLYLPSLENKKVGMVVNHSSLIGNKHLVDSLLSLGIDIQLLFAPEHGFRGEAGAGATIKDGIDTKTGLAIRSLYGRNKKPRAVDIRQLDILIFDIQDVGARFYTYISTLHYVMEACAENGVKLIVLDRPNPNVHYIDGPVLEPAFSSFVGMHPVPIVYGMTIGEYARMINGESWLKNGIRCDLDIVPIAWYTRKRKYELPVRPSPNLPNQRSIYLYPSLCFFEGTEISAGRGTSIPFQCFGAPEMLAGDFTFTPLPNGGAPYPKHKGKSCTGYNLTAIDFDRLYEKRQIDLSYLLKAYQVYAEESKFFLKTGYFDLLAGTDELRHQIIEGKSIAEIRASWAAELTSFKLVRQKYLLY